MFVDLKNQNKFIFLQIECQLLQYNTSYQLGCKFSPTPRTFYAVHGTAHVEVGEGVRIPEQGAIYLAVISETLGQFHFDARGRYSESLSSSNNCALQRPRLGNFSQIQTFSDLS